MMIPAQSDHRASDFAISDISEPQTEIARARLRQRSPPNVNDGKKLWRGQANGTNSDSIHEGCQDLNKWLETSDRV